MKIEINIWLLRAVTFAVAAASIIWASPPYLLIGLLPLVGLALVEGACRTR